MIQRNPPTPRSVLAWRTAAEFCIADCSPASKRSSNVCQQQYTLTSWGSLTPTTALLLQMSD
jgi:hypothetical protein